MNSVTVYKNIPFRHRMKFVQKKNKSNVTVEKYTVSRHLFALIKLPTEGAVPELQYKN